MSQPAFPGALPVQQVAERFAEASADSSHRFWPADIDLLRDQSIRWPRILGHRQITDVYLLALAVKYQGRLVTFDRRIDAEAVTGAEPRHLVTIRSTDV